jgi:DNA transformation protein and related proteins
MVRVLPISPQRSRGPRREDPFVAQCLELLAPLGAVRAKAMFGGHGLYIDELFVALIAFDSLYLKADAKHKPAFLAAGGQPFVYEGKGKPMEMGYCTVPAEAMDSPAAMRPWAMRAIEAALLARQAKPAKKRLPAAPAAPRAARASAPAALPAQAPKRLAASRKAAPKR